MSSIHFTLQGKGGVGKSLVSLLFIQYLLSKQKDVVALDADPVNQTLFNYKGINAETLSLVEDSNINPRNFDKLINRIITEPNKDYVIDNGASSFMPLSAYLVENDSINLLQENGLQVYVHTVITGGPALLDTLNGFKIWAKQSNVKIVVWLNEFFGKIEADGKTFKDMKVYNEHKENVIGTVLLPKRNQFTFAKDMEDMITKKMTFDEALASSFFGIAEKQRIKIIQRDIFEKLDNIGF